MADDVRARPCPAVSPLPPAVLACLLSGCLAFGYDEVRAGLPGQRPDAALDRGALDGATASADAAGRGDAARDAAAEASCAADGDGDGVDDCLDGCPLDVNKTQPGDCGCGVVDVAGCAGFPGLTKSLVCRFDTTPAGADVPDDVTDFPLLLQLSDPAVIDAVRSSGVDIRFYDPDGTSLSYEVVLWQQDSDRAEVWVKVPRIDGNSDADFITLAYAGPEVESASDGTRVFDNGFHAVWHLDGDPPEGEGALRDSTAHGFHGTASPSMTGDSRKRSIIGRGMELDGVQDYIRVTTLGDFGSRMSRGPVHVQLWFQAYDAVDPPSQSLMSAGTAQGGRPFNVRVNEGYMDQQAPGVVQAVIRDDATTGANRAVSSPPMPLHDGEWHFLAVVTDPSTRALGFYLDGTALDSKPLPQGDSLGPTSDLDQPLYLGAHNNRGTLETCFHGMLDEVQLSLVARSASWIKLSYENQRAAQKLVRFE